MLETERAKLNRMNYAGFCNGPFVNPDSVQSRRRLHASVRSHRKGAA
jgi:hypothetical protein